MILSAIKSLWAHRKEAITPRVCARQQPHELRRQALRLLRTPAGLGTVPRCGSLPRAGGETAVTVVGLARAA